MRIRAIILLAMTFFPCTLASAQAFGKILVDPNAGSSSSTTDGSAATTDQRLSERITYFSGYARLSDAVSAIGKISGIQIYTGKSNSDWQVRDMPVVICANNIEVGKLLKLITDAYFLYCTERDVDGVPVYRILRAKALAQQLDKYKDAMSDYANQWASTQRNALCYAGSLDSKDAEKLYQQILKDDPRFGSLYKSDIGSSRLAFDEAVLYGKFVNALGDEGMARLYRGETIKFSVQQGGYIGSLVEQYARLRPQIESSMAHKLSEGGLVNDSIPSDEDIQQASISFRISPNNSSSFPLESVMEIGSLGGSTAFTGDLSGFTAAMRSTVFPPVPGAPKSQNRDLIEVRSNKDVDSEKRYLLPKQKTNEDKLQLADVITAVSQATGFTIVGDDYNDQKSAESGKYARLFSDKVSLLDLKRALEQFTWYMDKDKTRVILRDQSWCDKYLNLIPKSSLAYLRNKLNGAGIDLPDLLALSRLTDGQRLDWVTGVVGLEALSPLSINSVPFTFLTGLNSQDVANSLSEAGVPASALGKDQLNMVLNRYSITAPKPTQDVSQLTFRLIKEERANNKYTYKAQISGSDVVLEIPLAVIFPIFSENREKELGIKTLH